MVATSVARFTSAVSTPSVARRNRSIRLTHEAHVIPSIGRRTMVGGWSFILPGSISVAVPDAGPPMAHTDEMALDHVVTATLDGGDTPFRVAASTEGIVAAAWEADDAGFRSAVAARLHAPVEGLADVSPDDPAARRLRAALPAIESVLRGMPADVRDVAVDLADRPVFDRRVLGAVRDVGWGETASYGEIAQRVGMPRAARAVGGALGRNPVSMLIPCHRIIAGDGTLGGYGGAGWLDRDRQRWRKEALLHMEGVFVPRRDG